MYPWLGLQLFSFIINCCVHCFSCFIFVTSLHSSNKYFLKISPAVLGRYHALVRCVHCDDNLDLKRYWMQQKLGKTSWQLSFACDWAAVWMNQNLSLWLCFCVCTAHKCHISSRWLHLQLFTLLQSRTFLFGQIHAAFSAASSCGLYYYNNNRPQ